MFYFNCKCEACTLPALKYFVEIGNAKKCLKCDGALCQIENNLLCISCGDKPQHYEKIQIIEAKKLYEKAQDSINSGELLTAVLQIQKCLQIRKNVLYKYNQKILDTLVLSRNLFFRKGDMLPVTTIMGEIIDKLEKRYEFNSFEVFQEFDICVNYFLHYLQEESNTTIPYRRNVLNEARVYLNEMEKIANFMYGSWSKCYEDIKGKQEMLVILERKLNI